ncbi:MAG: Sec-independent protein translocase subunit TatA [Corynebacteriales bacterium]|nr:Sec-independent protein translocase subunit TatA [Mycobacteriales bacterium]
MRPWHIVVVVLVFLLFFGIPKLPELARAIGRSLRIFKAETKDLMSDDVQSKADAKSTSELNKGVKSEQTEKSSLTGEVLDAERDKR